MVLFASTKERLCRKFLLLRNGLPTHDTLRRLFPCIDPGRFRAEIRHFVTEFSETGQGVIVIDAKIPRRSFDPASGQPARRMVSGWGLRTGHCAGLDRHGRKSNEITVLPETSQIAVAE